MKSFKLCFIGTGSIAKRHIKNIYGLFQEENELNIIIDLLRRKDSSDLESEIAAKIHNIYYSYDKLPSNYDVIFITNPTSMHYETLKKVHNNAKHFFIEKPVFDIWNETVKTIDFRKNSVYYVACPLRYTNVVAYLKNYIDSEEIYSARCISSSYLPDWRQGIDYRETYSAHAEMGGGVSIDLIHEWDYISYFFGIPEKVYSLIEKVSGLDITSDDIAVYIGRYSKKIVELHLDYFGRETIRKIELYGKNETVIGDLVNHTVEFMSAKKKIDLKEERDEYQKRELKHFFDILAGKEENKNTIENACNILKLAKGQIG